jgi:hypothetical protein
MAKRPKRIFFGGRFELKCISDTDEQSFLIRVIIGRGGPPRKPKK